jgi:exopolysaccharide biosynthesis polyprenyl glycosylphosphotransferase
MVRRHTTALRASLMAADFLVAAVLFAVVSMARYGPAWQERWHLLGVNPWLAATAFGAGWTLLISLQGLYRVRARYALRTEAIALAKAGVVLGIGMVILLFVQHVSNASRLLIGVLIVATVVLTVLERAALRFALAWLRERGHFTRFVIVAGSGPTAVDFADRLTRNRDLGLKVIGYLRAPSDSHLEGDVEAAPILGTIDQVEQVLHDHVVDEVAICLPVADWNLVEPITKLCANEGKIVRIPETGGPSVHGGYAEEFDGIAVVSLVYGPDRALGLLIKRLSDVVLSALGLVLISPVLLAIYLYVRRKEGAPVIYRQTRVGLNGRSFWLLKFRTMVLDADKQVDQLALLNEVRGNAFKITNDPRLTRSGAFLRRTSLDELPQLWNVLRGDMSLVGPRPPLPIEVIDYDIWHRRRLSMKPGMTGLWQVTARNNPDFDRWVERDLEYIDRWSLWLDLTILARTLPALMSQQGR